MKEKNLLADLAAYLFAQSDGASGRTPSERELADHFGVSRGQVREALAILEAMRIVERRAKSGIYLTTREASVEALALFAKAGVPLDPIQIYETVELRKIHEIKAAELACTRATEDNFERLREILRESEEQLARGEGLARQDRDFHLEIVRATQNSVFHKVCSVYYLLGEHRLPIYFSDPDRGRRSHAEHLQIFDAILRRDGNLAQALMSAHLQGAESYWKGLIGGNTPEIAAAHAGKGLSRLDAPYRFFDAPPASARRSPADPSCRFARCFCARRRDADRRGARRLGRDRSRADPAGDLRQRAEAEDRHPPRRRHRHDPGRGGDEGRRDWLPTCLASMRRRSPSMSSWCRWPC